MDIGTAKILVQEQEKIPHYNLSLLSPLDNDNAKAFYERVHAWERKISMDFPYVIYAGGSTLYIQAILFPVDEVPSSNPENIQKLSLRVTSDGISHLYEELKRVDPAYCETMDGMNTQRIIRALDVYYQTGMPFSSFHDGFTWEKPNCDFLFGLHVEREELNRRINARVEHMFADGLEEEVDKLLAMGVTESHQAMRTVGYKEIIEGRKLGTAQSEYMAKIKTNSRRYAKRQMTFFKRWPTVRWIDVTHITPLEAAKQMQQEIENQN